MLKPTVKMAAPKVLTQIGKPKPLADQVYDRLLNLITSPEMPPDSRLSIDALVREFNVSQTPIRQALVRLETQGMVVRKLNIGYSTPPLPTTAELSDIFYFRLMVEPETAKAAAENATKADIAALVKIAREMEIICLERTYENYGKFAAKDAQFHEIILKIAGNSVALEAIQHLNVHSHLFRLHFHRAIIDDALIEHQSIIDAIAKNDGDGAKKAMQVHIQASLRRLEPYF